MTVQQKSATTKSMQQATEHSDRIALDALRALDDLEEQLFGDRLGSIVLPEAIVTKRQRLLHEEETTPF